jgi:hypothetical protein
MTKRTRLGAIDSGEYCTIVEITELTILPEVKEIITGKNVRVEYLCWSQSKIYFSEKDTKKMLRSKHRSIREITDGFAISTETIVDYEIK